MYFLGKIYQSLKVIVGTVGLVGSGLVIIYGAVGSGGTVFIVGGVLCLLESLFVLGDSSKVMRDMRKQVNALKNEVKEFGRNNAALRHNVEDLQRLKAELMPRIEQLQGTLDQTVAELEQLEQLKDEYVAANKQLSSSVQQQEGQVLRLADENTALTAQVQGLAALKQQIEGRLVEYRRLYESAEEQLHGLEHVKADYEAENAKLREHGEALDGQVSALERENAKLHVLWKKSKDLLATLSTMGDRYDQFSSTLGRMEGDVDDLDRLTNRMDYLVERVQAESFDALDLDGNGAISKEEWEAAVERAGRPPQSD